MKRVVVTGIGVVSCLGNNQDEVYQSLLNSKSGISFSDEYKEYNLKSNIHGKPKINLEDHVDRKFIRFMGPGSAYNYISMAEAVKDSGLEDKDKILDQFLKNSQKAKVETGPEKPVLLGRDLLDSIDPGQEMGRLLRLAYDIQIDEEIGRAHV